MRTTWEEFKQHFNIDSVWMWKEVRSTYNACQNYANSEEEFNFLCSTFTRNGKEQNDEIIREQ